MPENLWKLSVTYLFELLNVPWNTCGTSKSKAWQKKSVTDAQMAGQTDRWQTKSSPYGALLCWCHKNGGIWYQVQSFGLIQAADKFDYNNFVAVCFTRFSGPFSCSRWQVWQRWQKLWQRGLYWTSEGRGFCLGHSSVPVREREQQGEQTFWEFYLKTRY